MGVLAIRAILLGSILGPLIFGNSYQGCSLVNSVHDDPWTSKQAQPISSWSPHTPRRDVVGAERQQVGASPNQKYLPRLLKYVK